ncbi:hypothetical protein [Pelagibacterium sediminicola]|nr:hypothetical protein [Pelagibacterium sediminicola]
MNVPQKSDGNEPTDIKKATLKFLQILLMLAGVYFICERLTYYAIMFFTS